MPKLLQPPLTTATDADMLEEETHDFSVAAALVLASPEVSVSEVEIGDASAVDDAINGGGRAEHQPSTQWMCITGDIFLYMHICNRITSIQL